MSAADLKLYSQELSEAIENLMDSIERLSSLPDGTRAKEGTNLQRQAKAATELYGQFSAELKDLPAAKAAKYREMDSKFKTDLKEIEENLAKFGAGNGSSSAASAAAAPPKPVKTTREIIVEAKKIQGKTYTKTEELIRMVQNAIEVGQATAQQIEVDTERMAAANEKLDDIQDELGLAKVQIVKFARKMATDKLLRAGLIILLLGALALLIIIIVQNTQTTTTSPTATPV